MKTYKKYLVTETFDNTEDNFTEDEKKMLDKAFGKKYKGSHSGIPWEYDIRVPMEDWNYRSFDVFIKKNGKAGKFTISSELDRPFSFTFKPKVKGSGKTLQDVIKKAENGIQSVQKEFNSKWKKVQDADNQKSLKTFGDKKWGDYLKRLKSDWKRRDK